MYLIQPESDACNINVHARTFFRYSVAVKAYDAATLESSAAISPSVLIDTTAPEGISCTTYHLESEANLTMSVTPSLYHESYNASLPVHLPAGEQLLKVTVTATSLNPGARGEVTLDSLVMPLVFDFPDFDLAVSEHVLVTPGGGLTSVHVRVHGNSGAVVAARVMSCAASNVTNNDAVSLRQISPSTVSVCSRVVDRESSLMSLRVGLGSTPGGLQVRPLTHVGQSGHAVLDVDVDHGTPLYAIVFAQNHAGMSAHFVSRSVIFDGTAPEVSGLNVSLSYTGAGGVKGTATSSSSVTVEAEWTVVDAETTAITCQCVLGKLALSILEYSDYSSVTR